MASDLTVTPRQNKTYVTRVGYLGVGNLHVTKAPVYHVPLGEDTHLGLIIAKPNETKPFTLVGLGVLLDL